MYLLIWFGTMLTKATELKFGTMLTKATELNNIEEARFKILSLPWFDTYINFCWCFNYLQEICC